MPRVITFTQESAIGPWAKRVRKALRLTQQELAEIAGVSREDVDLLEHNLPVRLDAKRKLIRELWAARNAKYKPLSRSRR